MGWGLRWAPAHPRLSPGLSSERPHGRQEGGPGVETGKLGATGSLFGEQPGCFPWRGAEPCSPQLGLTLRMGARPHPAAPLGLALALAAAAPPPAAPGAGTALRGGRTGHPTNHSPITPKPPPVPTCSLLLQLLCLGPDFGHVVFVGFQQLWCPRVPLAGLSLRHRGSQEPHGAGDKAGDKACTPCG